MALDIEKLKKAQSDVAARMSRGSGPSMKYWKPAEGVNRIRILPPWTEEGPDAGTFWREVWQHWNVSEESGPILCPKKTAGAENTECPICDFVDALRLRKQDVAAQEKAKDLRAKVAYMMSVIDLTDPVYTVKDVSAWKKERPDSEPNFAVGDAKVQVYASTSTIYEQIASIVINNEMDITDPDAGHNIILTKIGNPSNKMLTRYTVMPDLKKTKAPVPDGYVMPDLGKIGRFQPLADMTKALAEGAGGTFKALLPSQSSSGRVSADGNSAWGVEATSGDDLAAEMMASLKQK